MKFQVPCRLSVLLLLSKYDCKISVSFKQIQNFKVSHLAMAKVKKVNIEVTYSQMAILLMLARVEIVSRVEHTCQFTAKKCIIKVYHGLYVM